MDQSGIIQLLMHYRYLILFPLAAFEGPIISLFAGILVSLGYFNPFIAYIILLLGDLVPDTIYYYVGRHGNSKTFLAKHGHKVGITEKRFETIEYLWKEHGFKTMFMSKLAYGLSTPFLITAGLSGMTLGRFYLFTIPVTVIQYAAFMLLGFYFGSSYEIISQYFKSAEIVIAGLAIVAIAAYYFFSIYMKTELVKKEDGK